MRSVDRDTGDEEKTGGNKKTINQKPGNEKKTGDASNGNKTIRDKTITSDDVADALTTLIMMALDISVESVSKDFSLPFSLHIVISKMPYVPLGILFFCDMLLALFTGALASKMNFAQDIDKNGDHKLIKNYRRSGSALVDEFLKNDFMQTFFFPHHITRIKTIFWLSYQNEFPSCLAKLK